ncbi:hypothetical protein [Ralstonia syzygii]|uniref:Uncharacterized protein n=1 Tax=Ralstonia syzygii R24 TaxID=907261 RepID=G2ZY95_9RALS|nr:hypothetical protein [Ralstonia syzygii]CCA85289.1 hypothetical protein RALSY_11299 [Ralstonia syzygii R24]
MSQQDERIRQEYEALLAQALQQPGVAAVLEVYKAAQAPMHTAQHAAYAAMVVAPTTMSNHSPANR